MIDGPVKKVLEIQTGIVYNQDINEEREESDWGGRKKWQQ